MRAITESNTDGETPMMISTYLPFEIDGAAYVVPVECVYAILPASEALPSCVPPGSPSYVKRLILIEQNLVPVVEWSLVTQKECPQGNLPSRTMIVILRYQKRMLGALVDHVDAPVTVLEPKLEWDATKTHTLLIYENIQYILFDLPTVFQN